MVAPQHAGLSITRLVGRIEYVDGVFWNRQLYDRWPLVVKLSDRITVEPYRQVPPISDLGEDAIGVSGIGTIAAGRVIPRDNEEEAFVAVSMYARWLRPHPSTKSKWSVGYPDASAHRIISDLSAFIGHTNPTTHRILAAGDLNMFYGAIGSRLSLPQRDRTVWDRMQALGLEFLGPQAPHGRRAETTPDDVPPDTKNVPTYYRRSGPATAVNQSRRPTGWFYSWRKGRVEARPPARLHATPDHADRDPARRLARRIRTIGLTPGHGLSGKETSNGDARTTPHNGGTARKVL